MQILQISASHVYEQFLGETHTVFRTKGFKLQYKTAL